MKLYVWHEVLEDHTAGVMFALANSAEEAREIIMKEAGGQVGGTVHKDLKIEPSVYDSPVGFAVWGGG